MPDKVKVHFSRDGKKPVCGAVGRHPSISYTVTENKDEVTCGRVECRREAGAVEPPHRWRDEYQRGIQPSGS